MIEEKDYGAFECKISCSRCGSHFYLEQEDGQLVLRCARRCECMEASCQSTVIVWDDLAAEVSKSTAIIDLHLDFLWNAVDHIEIDGYKISVTMVPIVGEIKSAFLRLQDYWLAQYSIQGDESAKEKIYTVHSPLVKRRLYYLGRNSPLNRRDLEDLEQLIWLRIFQYLSSYNGEYRLWTWMKLQIRCEFCRMCKQKSKMVYSDEAVRIQFETRAIHGKSNIDRWMDNEHVSELLSILSDRERYVVVEYLFKHRQQKEIAVDMHVCRQKANEVYLRALRKMRVYELTERAKSINM